MVYYIKKCISFPINSKNIINYFYNNYNVIFLNIIKIIKSRILFMI